MCEVCELCEVYEVYEAGIPFMWLHPGLWQMWGVRCMSLWNVWGACGVCGSLRWEERG